MWPFTKRYSLSDSGLLQGLTDWHCHLLPGVDDGVPTVEETLQVLSSFEREGIREVWLTPHIMEDVPNTPASLRARYIELQAAYQGPVTLHLAAEHMLDSLFEERLRQGDLLPLGKEGRHLLVETSYFRPPYGLHNILLRIKAKGYVPVLAHPERYLYMDKEEYEGLKQLGVAFQLNLPSLVGAYGPEARRKAKWLLENRNYQFSGTDTHRLSAWESVIRQKQVSKDVWKLMTQGS